MPSKIRHFQFRNPAIRLKLESMGFAPDSFTRALLTHSEASLDDGICPVCKKSFSECDYFKKLDD